MTYFAYYFMLNIYCILSEIKFLHKLKVLVLKKIVCLICFVIIFISFSTICYASNGAFDTIKLGLFFGQTAKNSVNLSCDGGFFVGYEQNGEFIQTMAVELPSVRAFVNGDGQIEIEGVSAFEGDMTIKPGAGFLKIEGNAYRGDCQLVLKDGKMTVINKLPTEEYLYSVLGKEMSPSWPIEALKAQAICARTYAVRNWNKFSSYGFNLCTTTVSQVYGGIATESERTIDAVNQTSGQLLKYNGQVAEALFFASDGGYTADAKYVWGGSVPYLTAKEDPYEVNSTASYGTWTVTLSAEEVAQKLLDRSINIGRIKNVRVTGEDNHTVYEVEIVGDNGTYSVKNDSVRTLFGLKSQYFTIDAKGGNSGTIAENWSLFRKNAYEYYVNGDFGIFADGLPSAGSFTFNGRGYGHRVGMSQCGARDMALMGFSAYKILDFYYTGTVVE